MLIRKADLNDVEGIYKVYKESARVHPESLTQYEDEITIDYIRSEVKNALERGLILVAVDDGQIIGSFKAYTSKFRKLAHIMTNSTFTAIPTYKGKRAFLLLFKKFFNELSDNYKYIYKFEGVPHESSKNLIHYYIHNGLKIEGYCIDKIYNQTNSNFEKEVTISWKNPNFNKNLLKEYYNYLAHLL